MNSMLVAIVVIMIIWFATILYFRAKRNKIISNHLKDVSDMTKESSKSIKNITKQLDDMLGDSRSASEQLDDMLDEDDTKK